MKLFRVDYVDDCDDETFLTVGEDKESVRERVCKELSESGSCFMLANVTEVDAIDGYSIKLEDNKVKPLEAYWDAFKTPLEQRTQLCDM